jgi:lipoic acid synthetase
VITAGGLRTVCQEARCPNAWECFARRTATFLILGDRCTRDCRFCNIASGPPRPVDPEEPRRVAEAAARLELDHVVVTAVTRDDLPDGGASHFAATIEAVRRRLPSAAIEVLVPDFGGDRAALAAVLAARPAVLNHNLETVARLYPLVRPQALYARSLALLAAVEGIPAKSGIMLGLGESTAEVRQALRDLHRAGCRILTLGQYLRPSPRHLPVARYVPPEEFARLGDEARAMGFSQVASAPLVRSSYRAGEFFRALRPPAISTGDPPPDGQGAAHAANTPR